MKNTLLIILMFYSLKITFCQDNNSEINQINEEVTGFLSLNKNVNYINSNGYYFGEVPVNKDYKSRLSGIISIKDTSKIDLLKLDINFSIDEYKYYFVSNLNIILVIKSIDRLKNEMK